jgi:hypothetical protein
MTDIVVHADASLRRFESRSQDLTKSRDGVLQRFPIGSNGHRVRLSDP